MIKATFYILLGVLGCFLVIAPLASNTDSAELAVYKDRVIQLEQTVEKYEKLGTMWEKYQVTDTKLHAAYQKMIDELKQEIKTLKGE